MSSLKDGFGGGVEDMLLRGITEETLFLASHQCIRAWCEKSTALFMIYPMLSIVQSGTHLHDHRVLSPE